MTSGYSIIFFIKSFSIELISTFFISILVLFFLVETQFGICIKKKWTSISIKIYGFFWIKHHIFLRINLVKIFYWQEKLPHDL